MRRGSTPRREGYFYPRPPRGGRPGPAVRGRQSQGISIHALREEGDPPDRQTSHQTRPISIHALREEGDTVWAACGILVVQFLSTPSARRATDTFNVNTSAIIHFYPRPPRGGRPEYKMLKKVAKIISIHALREEGDTAKKRHGRANRIFLSTPSARRATCYPLP